MASSRLDEPVTTGGRAPVVDILAPPVQADPDDALAGLLPGPAVEGEYTADQVNLILGYERMKRRRRLAEAEYKGLSAPIAAALELLIEMKAELGIGRDDWVAVHDPAGFDVKPVEYRTIWPKYRIDPDTDKPYTRDQLVEALIACGYGDLIVTQPDGNAYAAMVRKRVKEWRALTGETGVKREGVFVDHDGTPLVGDELDDPTADVLALPRALRAVAEPTELLDIRPTRTETEPAPTAADETPGVAPIGG